LIDRRTLESIIVRTKKKSMLEKMMNDFGIGLTNVQLRDPRAIEAAQALNLSQSHLRKLKIKFDRIDVDGSGNIDSDEFFEAVGESRSPLTDRLFAMIDLDGSGTIEFDEYVRVMATYCMFTKDEILRFCFECFDVDSSGTIDEKEFIELCK
jgi:Ca2+-binding EF-hand superfamily protein